MSRRGQRKSQIRRLPPGPRPWPIIGNLTQLGPKPHQSMAELAKVHGPLMHLKVGFVHVVVAASASTAEQFLKVHEANFLSRPLTSSAKYVTYNYRDLVFAPYGPRWRLLRKICAVHLFSNKSLDGLINIRQEEIRILTGALVNARGTPAKLGQMLNVSATNALSRAMLGRRVVGHQVGGGDSKAEEFKEMVMELMRLAGEFNIGDFISPLDRFDLQGIVKKMKKLHSQFDAFLSLVIEEHKINGSGGAEGNVALLSTLISMKDGHGSEGRFTETEIKALFVNLFIAGTDTTSSTVEWAIAELLSHPTILAQARQEIDSVIGKERLVIESDLPHLPFLQAVVKETFRLHPSTPLSLPRIAQESCEINGYFIPKDSTLLMNVWAIGRDPDVWADPLEFRPNRFLSGGERPNADVRGNDFELIPFGAGRRICAGLGLGIRMVQLLTATLINGIDFELVNGSAHNLNMEEAYGLTLQRAEPLLVSPKPRLPLHVYEAQ